VEGGLCKSHGILEFSVDSLHISETAGSISLEVRRQSGSDGPVSVDYDTSQVRPHFTRLEQGQGTVSFADGEVVKQFSLKVFKRMYFESDTVVFTVSLFLPEGGAEIGYYDTLKVYYYDDDTEMLDAYYTYATLNGQRNKVPQHGVVIGVVNAVDIFAYHTETLAKSTGGDMFILRVFDRDGR